MRGLAHGRVEVGEDPKLIAVAGQDVSSVSLHNFGDATVFIGSEAVAAEGDLVGFPLPAGESLNVQVFASDATEIFGVTAEGTAVLVYLT